MIRQPDEIYGHEGRPNQIGAKYICCFFVFLLHDEGNYDKDCVYCGHEDVGCKPGIPYHFGTVLVSMLGDPACDWVGRESALTAAVAFKLDLTRVNSHLLRLGLKSLSRIVVITRYFCH